MTLEMLKQRRQTAEQQFIKLQQQRTDIDAEMTKLQGAYRELTSIIEEWEKHTTAAADEAVTQEAEEATTHES